MDAKELRAKSPEELSKELSALLRAHFGLRMQHATQQLANNSELRKTRRSIARVRTVQREQTGGLAQPTTAPTTKAKRS